MYLRWDGNRPLADRAMLAALYQVSERSIRRHCHIVDHVPRTNPPPDVRGGTALYDALQAAADLADVAPRPERTVAALNYRLHRDRNTLPTRGDHTMSDSLDNGGALPRGETLAINTTGEPEQVRDHRLPPADATDLGHDVHVTFTGYLNNAQAGLRIYHRTPAGTPCIGTVLFDLPAVRAHLTPDEASEALWELVSLDPIHISPSVHCSCGTHGWIQHGRWVPA